MAGRMILARSQFNYDSHINVIIFAYVTQFKRKDTNSTVQMVGFGGVPIMRNPPLHFSSSSKKYKDVTMVKRYAIDFAHNY